MHVEPVVDLVQRGGQRGPGLLLGLVPSASLCPLSHSAGYSVSIHLHGRTGARIDGDLIITARETLEFKDFPLPEVGAPGAVVVALTRTGICGSDVSAYKMGFPYSPYLCGHEWGGKVHSVGKGVERFTVGDRVTRGILPSCGTCSLCLAGHHDRCLQRNGLSAGTHPLAPAHGAYAARIMVPAELLVPVPDSVTDEQAAMVEPATVALHAVRQCGVQLGTTAVVLGAGAVGLFAAQLLRESGALRVIVVDPIDKRRRLALELGADAAAAPGDALDAVLDVTGGLGADVVVDLMASGRLRTDGINDLTIGLDSLPDVFADLARGREQIKVLVDQQL